MVWCHVAYIKQGVYMLPPCPPILWGGGFNSPRGIFGVVPGNVGANAWRHSVGQVAFAAHRKLAFPRGLLGVQWPRRCRTPLVVVY